MVGISTGRWESLERLSATLFLVAGGLMVIHTGVHAAIAFTDMTYPLHHEMPFGLVGHIIAFVALLGLYPQLKARSPKLARAGAALAVFGTIGWIAIGTMTLSADLNVATPDWLAVFGPLTILSVIVGYLVFGIAGYRTELVTRRTALAIASPALVMVYNLVVGITTGGSPEGQIVVAGGFALTHLAIGAALRAETFPDDARTPGATVPS